MIEWDSSRGCKYFSISTNQSMWYTSSTKCRIKTVYDHLNRCRKVFDKIHHSFTIKNSRKWAFREHQSVQFSHSVVLDSLRPHDSQHARPPCPSPTPGVHSDSRPSSQWCHPAILSSVVPFSSCPQSLPASESFPMSQLFAWGDQSTGVSALASFLPKNTGLISFRMDWLDLLAVQGTLKSLPQHYSSKPSILRCSALFTVQLSHDHRKNHSLD